MPTVLITGANRGIGLEFARQYAATGWRVIATCRQPSLATELKALPGEVEIFALDVGDFPVLGDLAKSLKRESVDLLLANAGVYGPRPSPFGAVDDGAWEAVLRLNTIAPLKLAEAFCDLVARSELRSMAFLSSKMGSIADNTSGGSYIYRSSKAALNVVVKSLAVDLAPRGISVAALHPGWVRTDMGGPSALIDAEVSVAGMRRVLADLTPETSGRFLNYDGCEIPW